MQKEKTVEFWNQHHEQITNQEWIVNPTSKSLVQKIISLLKEEENVERDDGSLLDKQQQQQQQQPSTDDGINVRSPYTRIPSMLEIGCGTSQLSKEIYLQLKREGRFVITDISPICIQSNQQRDIQLIQESNGDFEYQILDVTKSSLSSTTTTTSASPSSPSPSSTSSFFDNESFHIILDKGCLDTLLFRSERRIHELLVTNLLNSVHAWMIRYYVVITPRPKIKVLRDFQGFCHVQRFVIHDDLGDLEGRNCNDDDTDDVVDEKDNGLLDPENDNCNNDKSNGSTTSSSFSSSSQKKEVYMFVCTKNNQYHPAAAGVGKTTTNNNILPAFIDGYDKGANQDIETSCQSCDLLFTNFGMHFPMAKRIRQWKGHRLHCKTSTRT